MKMTLTRTPAGNVTIRKVAKCIHAESTLAGGGGTLDFDCQLSDLFAREDIEGDPSWKILDGMVKNGDVTSITFVADPDDLNVVDEANEV